MEQTINETKLTLLEFISLRKKELREIIPDNKEFIIDFSDMANKLGC